MQTGPWLKLRPREIEKTFTHVVSDPDRILLIDGIDMHETGFRIRCHDLYGPLPVIAISERQINSCSDSIVRWEQAAKQG